MSSGSFYHVNRVTQDEFYLLIRSVDGGVTFLPSNSSSLFFVKVKDELALGKDWEVAVTRVDHPGVQSSVAGKWGLAYLMCDFVNGPVWAKDKLYMPLNFPVYVMDTFRVGSSWGQYVANPRTYRPIRYEKFLADGRLSFIIVNYTGAEFPFVKSGVGAFRNDVTTIELHFRKRKPLYTPAHRKSP